ALALGGFFLATAASWSDAPLSVLAAPSKGDYGLLYLAQAVQPPAFFPYFLWAFVRDFPAPSPHRRRFRLPLQVSAWTGSPLFASNLPARPAGQRRGRLPPVRCELAGLRSPGCPGRECARRAQAPSKRHALLVDRG